MGTLTGTYIASKAKELMVDADGVSYTDTQILEWINEAQRAVSLVRPDAKTIIENVPLAAGFLQNLPQDTRRLMRVFNNLSADLIVGSVIEGPVAIKLWDRFNATWRSGSASEVEEYSYNPANPKQFFVRPPLAEALTLFTGVGSASFTGESASFTYNGWAQSFEGNDRQLARASFYLRKLLNPTGSMYAKLYAHAGTYGTSSIPTGDALATSLAVDVSTVPASMSFVDFEFTDRVSVSFGTNYVIALEYTEAGTGSLYVGAGIPGSIHPGNACFRTGAVWGAASVEDLIFQLYTEDAVVSYASAELAKNTVDLSTIDDSIDINDVYSPAIIHYVAACLCLRDDERTPNHERGRYHMEQFFAVLGVKTQSDAIVAPQRVEEAT